MNEGKGQGAGEKKKNKRTQKTVQWEAKANILFTGWWAREPWRIGENPPWKTEVPAPNQNRSHPGGKESRKRPKSKRVGTPTAKHWRKKKGRTVPRARKTEKKCVKLT